MSRDKMLIPQHRLQLLFDKISQFKTEAKNYLIAGDRRILRVEEIQYLISTMYNLSIEKYEVGYKATFLQSVVLRYKDNRATILVKSDLPDANRRFSVVKELCHLMLDEPEDWSTDAPETIRGLIKTFKLPRRGCRLMTAG